MNKNLVIAVVLGVLVVIAGMQAWQLMGIKNKLQSGAVTSSGPAPAAGGSGTPTLPSSLQNLPGMVGGC